MFQKTKAFALLGAASLTLISLSGCDQVSSSFGPAKELIGEWGAAPNDTRGNVVVGCGTGKTLTFSYRSGDLAMSGPTGSSLVNRVERTSDGWELYADGLPNALVITQLSENVISLNMGPILGQNTFQRCS